MIALLQRVSSARVVVSGSAIGAIDAGLLVFAAVQPSDDERTAVRLAERVLGYRVFADAAGKMNRSVLDVGGGVLLVPQFTLAADTRSGTRPSFSTAAPPELGNRLFECLVTACRDRGAQVATGSFGAHMAVFLVNDGPVTFWLEVPALEAGAAK
jgi:D-tyrosyl-tRNA(Tyr) deacylase